MFKHQYRGDTTTMDIDNIGNTNNIIEGAAIGNLNAAKPHKSKGRKAKAIAPHPRPVKPKMAARSKPLKIAIAKPKKAVKPKMAIAHKPVKQKTAKAVKPAKAIKNIKPKTVKAPKLKTAKTAKAKAVAPHKNMNVAAKQKGTNLKGGKATKTTKPHTSKMKMKV